MPTSIRNQALDRVLKPSGGAYDIAKAWFAIKEFNTELMGHSRKFGDLSESIPSSQKELARLIDVEESTITSWTKRPDFQAGVSYHIHKLLGGEFRKNARKMISAVTTNALGGDTAAMNLWFKLYEKFSPGDHIEQDTAILEAQAMEAISKNPNERLASLLKTAATQSRPVEDADFEVE